MQNHAVENHHILATNSSEENLVYYRHMKLYPPHKSFGDLSIYCASMIHCIFKNDTTQLTAKLIAHFNIDVYLNIHGF